MTLSDIRAHLRAMTARSIGVASAARLGSLPRVVRSRLVPRHDAHSGMELETLHDSLCGATVLLVANGPSLRSVDWKLVQHLPAVTVNRAYLSHDDWGIRTVFHVVANKLVLEQFRDDLLGINTPLFLQSATPRFDREMMTARQAKTVFFANDRFPSFQTNRPDTLWTGSTVTFVALQLLHWLGARKIVIVGLDHSFVQQGDPNQTVEQVQDDQNHYRSDYFPPGTRWQLADLATSELAFRMAKTAYEASGREIVNCSDGTKLKVFRRSRLKREIMFPQ